MRRGAWRVGCWSMRRIVDGRGFVHDTIPPIFIPNGSFNDACFGGRIRFRLTIVWAGGGWLLFLRRLVL